MNFQDLMTQWSIADKQLHNFSFYRNIPSFKKTSVFLVGESLDATSERMKDIAQDVFDEMEDFVPFPFNDITLALKGAEDVWLSWRILSSIPENIKEFFDKSISENLTPEQLEERKTAKQFFFVTSGNFRDGDDPIVLPYFLGYMGFRGDGSEKAVYTRGHYPVSWVKELSDGFSLNDYVKYIQSENRITGFILKMITAISHPANYTLQVTPKLTDKEERNVRKFGNIPSHKKPYFITIDHDVLISMRDGKSESEEDRKSPIPHHRRGHWKRLADRCRQARLHGKEKVWVRPTFVGDTSFSDERNKYEVLMNFGSGVTAQ